MKVRWQDTGIVGFWDAAADYVDIAPDYSPNRGASLEANLLTEGTIGSEATRKGEREQYLEHKPDVEEKKVRRYWERNRGPPPSVQNQAVHRSSRCSLTLGNTKSPSGSVGLNALNQDSDWDSLMSSVVPMSDKHRQQVRIIYRLRPRLHQRN